MPRGSASTQAVRDDYLLLAQFEYLVENGIQTRQELHDFILVYLGFDVPMHAHCPGHQAPFDFIANQFFDEYESTLGFANRAGGKTQDTAILNACDMVFKAGVEICSAGAVNSQAKRGWDYLCGMIFGMSDYFEILYGSGPEVRKDTLYLPNGSNAQIITASFTGLNSPHPQRLRIDEVELIHHDLVNESMSITQSAGGIAAQDTYTSTRKISSGTMQKLLNEAGEKGISVVTWCSMEVIERCTRECFNDPKYGNCPIYSRKMADGTERKLCGGEAHNVPGGYYLIADWIKKARNMDADTFDAQWLCRRPNSGQLVYGQQFRDDERLIIKKASDMERILDRAKEAIEKKRPWQRVYGQDFGSHWATSGWIRDPETERWLKYWEYYFAPPGDRSIPAHCEFILKNDPLGFDIYNHTGFADPSGRQAITDMEEHGIFFLPANNQRYSGISFMKNLMETPLADGLPSVQWFGTCTQTIKEMLELYVHRANRDGSFDRDKIMDKDDHNCDSDRYALHSMFTLGTQQYTMRRLRGI